MKILIVADHASAQFGGEAALPLHYFRVLTRRKESVWLLVHERTRDELTELFPDAISRISFIPDTWMHKILWNIGRPLPARLSYFTTGFAMRLLTQLMQRRKAIELVKTHGIDVVHQPIPVSPKEPSMLFGLGAPVVIGPMNGGMDYPPAFRKMQGPIVTTLLKVARALGAASNRVMPGKRKAAVLLVANVRTQAALPSGLSSTVIQMVENGVNLDLWRQQKIEQPPSSQVEIFTRFIFLGRLVDWKAVDLLLHAFAKASKLCPMTLTIVGDGDERNALTALSGTLGINGTHINQPGSVFFAGWQAQADCAQMLANSHALVLPSLMECGGAVVLEAMAMGLPVIATRWGGLADYLDQDCGLLIEPTSREQFIAGLQDSLVKLAQSPELRNKLGQSGLTKVTELFDWERKVDNMLSIYANSVWNWNQPKI